MSQVEIVQIKKLPRWQSILAKSIRSPAELLKSLDLDPELISEQAHQDFKLRIPLSYLNKIEKGNPKDPLLMQVLPIAQEMELNPTYSKDPLLEQAANAIPGLLHKYKSRVLLTVTSACAINCRYCFRRHFAYEDNRLSQTHIDAVLNYLENHPEVNEVIYSGGDPLIASDEMLEKLSQAITAIPSIKRLRIHSRMAVSLPERITDAFIAWTTALPVPVILVTHCNHPNELDHETASNMLKLKQAGITLLNQTVLLKGINDDVACLNALSEKLFACHILPYYLHKLDKVQGAAHFDMEKEEAKQLYAELQKELPGFLLPKFVQETPKVAHKEIVI